MYDYKLQFYVYLFYFEKLEFILCEYFAQPLDVMENEDGDDQCEDDFQCMVYFWQGRDAGNMGWLTFTFR